MALQMQEANGIAANSVEQDTAKEENTRI